MLIQQVGLAKKSGNKYGFYSTLFRSWNDRNSRYVRDVRKYANTIYASCEFRKRQYEASIKHLTYKPEIKLHQCPQTLYSIKKSKDKIQG